MKNEPHFSWNHSCAPRASTPALIPPPPRRLCFWLLHLGRLLIGWRRPFPGRNKRRSVPGPLSPASTVKQRRTEGVEDRIYPRCWRRRGQNEGGGGLACGVAPQQGESERARGSQVAVHRLRPLRCCEGVFISFQKLGGLSWSFKCFVLLLSGFMSSYS